MGTIEAGKPFRAKCRPGIKECRVNKVFVVKGWDRYSFTRKDLWWHELGKEDINPCTARKWTRKTCSSSLYIVETRANQRGHAHHGRLLLNPSHSGGPSYQKEDVWFCR
jgi:hypothetical protein